MSRRPALAAVAAVRAEGTKLWTLAGIRWLLLATVGALVLVGAAAAATLDPAQCGAGGACGADPVKASLGGVWVAQIAVAVVGVLAVSSEYEPPQIRVTLAAMPRRLEVLAAKLAVVAGLVAVAGTVGTLGALAAGGWVVDRNGFGAAAAGGGPSVSLTEGTVLRAGVGTVCYLVLVAALSLGLAGVVRDAALALVGALSLLYLFPMLALVVTDPAWQHRLHRYAPMDAGLAVQASRGIDRLAIGPWAGLAVLAIYAAAALGAGGALFRWRDA
jgi:ABC-2 type transport system permease protein